MKKISILLVVLALATGLHAQSSFHKSFSLPDKDGILYRNNPTSDGGAVTVGRIIDFSTFDDDFLIMKTDASGNPSWIKRCFTTDFEEFTDVLEMADGTVVAAGTSTNMSTYLSVAVIRKFNSAGVSLWTRSYSAAGHSAGAKKITMDGSGNLYVLGTVALDGAGDDYFIMKLDAGGNILSQTRFGTPDSDYPLAFLRSENGNLFICGWDNTFTGENIHVLKINADMTVAWNKKISGIIRYFAYDMKELSNGDLVLAGRYDDGGGSYDILLCSLDDSNGEQVWAKSYSANDGTGTYAYGLTIGAGDVIAVTGPAESSDQGTFLFSADTQGNVSWSYKYGEPGATGMGYGVTTLTDGSYLVCGPFSNGGDAIVQLLKTNSAGILSCNSSSYQLTATPFTLPMQSLTITTGNAGLTAQDIVLNETSYSNLSTLCPVTGITNVEEPTVTLTPNPSDGRFTVSVPGAFAGAGVTVFNSSGSAVMQGWLPAAEGASTISNVYNMNVPSGVYFVNISNGNQQLSRKLVITR